jgi:hypothetical protein
VERPRDRHALLLPAGQPVDALVDPLRDPEPGEHGVDPLRLAPRDERREGGGEREASEPPRDDVLHDRRLGDEPELLVHGPDARAERPELPPGEPVHGPPQHRDRPPARRERGVEEAIGP